MSTPIPLPPPSCPQGKQSSTFAPPPFSASQHISELIDWHAARSAEHEVFTYFDEAEAEAGAGAGKGAGQGGGARGGRKRSVRWREFARAVYRIAREVSESVRVGGGEEEEKGERPLVGLYSSSDALTYITALLGIWRAGFPVFLISPRASPVSLRHLVQTSGVAHVVMNADDEGLRGRLGGVWGGEEKGVGGEGEGGNGGGKGVTVSYLPDVDALFGAAEGKEAEEEAPPPPVVKPDWDSLSLILHSSGSTALPELNRWTHRMIYNSIWHPWYGERDICGAVWSTPSAPMALATGVMQAVFVLSSGIIISGFKPTSPPTLPNPHNVWHSMVRTESTYCLILPPFLRLWAEDPEKVRVLAALEGVMFGGGPLPKEFGDRLAQAGVTLYTLYGMSETGMLNRAFTKKPGMEWEWFSFHPLLSPAFRQENESERTAELIIKSCPTHTPTKTNTQFEGVPALASGDLVQAHPEKAGLWRYFCRISDQEAVGPGEKINAVALARVLMSDPLIAGAVLFTYTAKGAIGVGAIIEPAPAYGGDLGEKSEVEVYLDRVWPTFEKYNAIAPLPARLSKERVILTSRDRPFVYSEKLMPRRKEAIKAYEAEIRALAG